MKPRILITGGCGFIGSNIAIALRKISKVCSLDNLSRKGSTLNEKRLSNYKIKNFRIDIKKDKLINKLPKFDIIIDCCAEVAVESSKKNLDKVFNTNLIGTFNILKKVKDDKSKIIFLSTSRVYSIKKLSSLISNNNIQSKIKLKNKMFVNENFSTLSPITFYGCTKLSSENLIKEFSNFYKIDYLINRMGVIAGPWQFGKQDQGFITFWVWRHLNRLKLNYIGYGGKGFQVRDVLHIDDLVDLILLQIKNFKNKKNEVFNVGGGYKNAINLNDLTNICNKITNNKISIGSIKKTSQYDVPIYITDYSKVKKVYNWRPKRNLKEIITDVSKWLSSNKFKISRYM